MSHQSSSDLSQRAAEDATLTGGVGSGLPGGAPDPDFTELKQPIKNLSRYGTHALKKSIRDAVSVFQERDFTADEVEFGAAMDKYKRDSGNKFPAWSEVLKVLRGLGYEKVVLP